MKVLVATDLSQGVEARRLLLGVGRRAGPQRPVAGVRRPWSLRMWARVPRARELPRHDHGAGRRPSGD